MAWNKMPNAASSHNGEIMMIATELRPRRGAIRGGPPIVPGAGAGLPPQKTKTGVAHRFGPDNAGK